MTSKTNLSYLDAILRAERWLVSACATLEYRVDDSHFVTSLYKAPLAARVLGNEALLQQVIRLLQNVIEGGRIRETDLSQDYLTHCPDYRNAWVAVGTGELISVFTSTSEPCPSNMLSASCRSIAAFSAGDEGTAVTAASNLLPIAAISRNGAIPFVESEETCASSSIWNIASKSQPNAKTYVPALAIVALAQAHLVSGDSAFLNAALRLWDCLTTFDDALYRGDYVGKIALANAQLYRATADPRYKENHTRALEVLMSWQTEEGPVVLPHRYGDLSVQPREFTFDRTSEFIVAVGASNAIIQDSGRWTSRR